MNFADQYPKFIAMLQFKKPALLEKMKVKNGVKVIDRELLQAIDQEHEEMIKKLKSLSEDIEIIYTYKRVMNGLTIIAPLQLTNIA